MGCVNTKGAELNKGKTQLSKLVKPAPWKSQEPITVSALQKLRDEFWDTAPHYGGERVIWEALQAASVSDIQGKKVILEAADIILASSDMTVCYDQKGRKYELPVHVLSDPRNLLPDEESDS